MNNAAPQLDRENRKAHQNQFPAQKGKEQLFQTHPLFRKELSPSDCKVALFWIRFEM